MFEHEDHARCSCGALQPLPAPVSQHKDRQELTAVSVPARAVASFTTRDFLIAASGPTSAPSTQPQLAHLSRSHSA